MVKVIGVRFRNAGKIYYFDPLDMDIEVGQNVIVETARGIEYGHVLIAPREVDNSNYLLRGAGERKAQEGKRPLFLILEDIQDPGNLGTMIRTGEGAGVDGILMSKGTVDIYNPKTIRSTMGSLYRVPFLYTGDLTQTIGQLQKTGIRVYAAHLKGTKSYREPDYAEGAAFLIGNEGNGLKEETAALADEYIRIPMQGKLESLNAAVAAALLMYEVAV